MSQPSINASGNRVESALSVFGAELKHQRETAGLSLDELFERTRINPSFLRAIEAGRFDELPDVYTRLFLKNYARAVGLDGNEAVARFDEILKTPEPEEEPEEPAEPPARAGGKKWLTGISVAVLVLALAAGIAYWLQPELFLPQTAQEPAPEPQAPPPPEEPPLETVVVEVHTMPADLPISGAETGLQLSGAATAKTWVWVWADGEEIFSSPLEAGEEQTWNANRHLQIEIENPASVTLQLAGEPLTVNADSAHRLRLYLSRFSIWAEERMLPQEPETEI